MIDLCKGAAHGGCDAIDQCTSRCTRVARLTSTAAMLAKNEKRTCFTINHSATCKESSQAAVSPHIVFSPQTAVVTPPIEQRRPGQMHSGTHRASRSLSSRARISSSRTGPLTFRMIVRVVSSMNSTRTWVTPPREPVRPRTYRSGEACQQGNAGGERGQ